MSSPFEAITGAPNACEATPTLVTAGQPERNHLEAFKAAGGGIVIDLRDPMEPRSFDEPAAVGTLGLEYVNLPVSPGNTSDAVIDRVREILRDAGDKPVFVHCAGGNRVGGALIPYFILDRGMSEDDAVTEAMRIGLRSPEYLQWGLDYAKRHASGGQADAK